MNTRQQLEQAADTLTKGQPQGQENTTSEAILHLVKANPNEPDVQQFIQQFEAKRGRPVG